MIRRFLAMQQRAMQKLPGTSSFCTGMVIMGIGDTSVQLACSGDGKLDMRRVSSVSLYNGASAPIFYNWWRWLDRMWPGRTPIPVLRKTLTNQVFLGAANSVAFLACTKCMEAWLGGGPRRDNGEADWSAIENEIVGKMQNEVPTLLCLASTFWIPAHYANFMFVPPQLRIVYTSVLGIVWGGFLSFVAHR